MYSMVLFCAILLLTDFEVCKLLDSFTQFATRVSFDSVYLPDAKQVTSLPDVSPDYHLSTIIGENKAQKLIWCVIFVFTPGS